MEYKETLALDQIKESDKRLRDFENICKNITKVKVDEFEIFSISLMYVNSYKEFIKSMNEISLSDIQITVGDKPYIPNKDFYLNNIQFNKFENKTIATYDLIQIMSEDSLKFECCNHDFITNDLLDYAIKYCIDNNLTDEIFEYCRMTLLINFQDEFPLKELKKSFERIEHERGI